MEVLLAVLTRTRFFIMSCYSDFDVFWPLLAGDPDVGYCRIFISQENCAHDPRDLTDAYAVICFLFGHGGFGHRGIGIFSGVGFRADC